MPDAVLTPTGARIRLTDERWAHILDGHGELAGRRVEVLETVERPERIVSGRVGELLAIREYEPGKSIVVVYRELGDDGFVITAFLTSRISPLQRRRQVWP